MEKLTLGIAYHGNRIYESVRRDLIDIVNHGFNNVVHMFSHTDWDRHCDVMKDIFAATTGMGLDLWVDNWGLNGSPGDTSHFLCYHPEAHQYDSAGNMNPKNVCLNNETFINWTKEWIDKVYDCGARKIFWDEPYLMSDESKFSCACPTCKKLFEERYNKKMPVAPDADCYDFQEWTIARYFENVTKYAASKGMENICCVMIGGGLGISLDNISVLGELETMNNIGTDPYWVSSRRLNTGVKVYDSVYHSTKKCIDVCNKYGKDHNIWIQGFGIPAGTENDIITAADAAYDAGARNILYWSFRGGESNNYRSKNTELAWYAMGQANMRLINRHNEMLRLEYRKQLGIDR